MSRKKPDCRSQDNKLGEAKATSSVTDEVFAVGVNEACRLIGVARSTLYREMSVGRIHARKAGKKTLFLMTDLRAWITSLPRSKVV